MKTEPVVVNLKKVDPIAVLEALSDVNCHSEDGSHEYIDCPFCYARHTLNEIYEDARIAVQAIKKIQPRLVDNSNPAQLARYSQEEMLKSSTARSLPFGGKFAG